MPPALWIVLTVSVLIVLFGGFPSSRTATILTAVLIPLVVTGLVWLLNMFFAEDYALGWRSIFGAIVIFVPSAVACAAAALILGWWKHRKSRE